MQEQETEFTYKGYRTKIEWSQEDEVFFGQILDTTDLVLFHGRTIMECAKDFELAVDDYIETKKYLGKE